MIRIEIPYHLSTLANCERELAFDLEAPVTLAAALDALEARYPMLRGTMRDQVTHKRRDFIRFFACGEDLSNDPPNTPLPEAVQTGDEPLLIVGAIAGG